MAPQQPVQRSRPYQPNENAMRKLFMLTALVFALFTGAAVAIVGAAILTQQSELVLARDNPAPRF
jgi:hypothetical protein